MHDLVTQNKTNMMQHKIMNINKIKITIQILLNIFKEIPIIIIIIILELLFYTDQIN